MIFALPGDKQMLGTGGGAQALLLSQNRLQGLWGRVLWKDAPSLGQALCREQNADPVPEWPSEGGPHSGPDGRRDRGAG